MGEGNGVDLLFTKMKNPQRGVPEGLITVGEGNTTTWTGDASLTLNKNTCGHIALPAPNG